MAMRLIGVIGLLVASPIILLSILVAFIDTGGPVFYNQTRVGHRGANLTVHKLRTYKNGQTTKLSRLMRKLGVDELPQLWNVAKGDMSLIGPRPELFMFANFADLDKRQSVLPGITGLSQILGGHGAGVIEEVYDLIYIDNKSIQLDLFIALLTPLVLLGYVPNKHTVLMRANKRARHAQVQALSRCH